MAKNGFAYAPVSRFMDNFNGKILDVTHDWTKYDTGTGNTVETDVSSPAASGGLCVFTQPATDNLGNSIGTPVIWSPKEHGRLTARWRISRPDISDRQAIACGLLDVNADSGELPATITAPGVISGRTSRYFAGWFFDDDETDEKWHGICVSNGSVHTAKVDAPVGKNPANKEWIDLLVELTHTPDGRSVTSRGPAATATVDARFVFDDTEMGVLSACLPLNRQWSLFMGVDNRAATASVVHANLACVEQLRTYVE